MEKKNKRKSSVLLILLLLVAVVGVVSYTYARYAASASASDTLTAAAFAVTVNDTNIVANDTYELTVAAESSDEVVSGKIAPGSTFTFTIVIDPTGTETALEYTVSNIAISGLSAASITGATINGEAATIASNAVSSTISLESGAAMTDASKQTIVITAEWPADGNNTTDTSLQGETVTMTADVSVQQYISD